MFSSLLPRQRVLHLLKGRAWVDAKTFSLVKLEGKQSASPSFWTGRPLIVRDYVPVSKDFGSPNAAMPHRMDS